MPIKRKQPSVVILPADPTDKASLLRLWVARVQVLGEKIAKNWNELIAFQANRKEVFEMDGEKLITGKEARERLAISERQFYRWVKLKAVPCVRIGHLARYKWSDIEKVLEASKVSRNPNAGPQE